MTRSPVLRRAWFLAASLGLATLAQAGDPIVFPAKGQSPKQQQADEAACHEWAVLQVGFDPTKVAPPKKPSVQAAQAQPTPSKGQTTTRGVLRGAAVSAGVASLAGGDAGEAALIGGALGGIRGHRKGEQQQAAAQQQAASQTQAAEQAAQQTYEQALADYNARKSDYSRARAACLKGKGYTLE